MVMTDILFHIAENTHIDSKMLKMSLIDANMTYRPNLRSAIANKTDQLVVKMTMQNINMSTCRLMSLVLMKVFFLQSGNTGHTKIKLFLHEVRVSRWMLVNYDDIFFSRDEMMKVCFINHGEK